MIERGLVAIFIVTEHYEGMKLSGAEICGITEDWLFVNIWEAREKVRHGPDDYGEYYESEDYENRKVVTYRIAMGSWEAEALAKGVYYDQFRLPRYNSVSDSLLIPSRNDDGLTLEAMLLNTRKRIQVLLDGMPLRFESWWENNLEGQAVLVYIRDAHIEQNDYYIFDEKNQVQLKSYNEMNFAVGWTKAPQNEMEKALRETPEEEGRIWECATAGDYVYYVQHEYDTQQQNLYRVKIDGTERKLLREKTNILYLQSTGDKLFCEAANPTFRPKNEWEGGQIDIYLLDKEGKVAEILFHYRDDTQGNASYGLRCYGDKMMVMYYSIYCPSTFVFLYDPATGARFPAQKG